VTVLENNFDGGPSGTTLTAANSAQGGDAFDLVLNANISGAVIRYSATPARPTAEYSMELSTGSTSTTPKFNWNTSMGTQTQVWARFYLYYASLPTGNKNYVWRAESPASPTGVCSIVGVEPSTGRLFLANFDATVFVYSTATVVAGSWMRIEARVQPSTTTGNADAWLYKGNDVDTDNVSDTITMSGQNFGAASATNYLYGYTSPSANLPQMFLSGVGLSSDGPLGPLPFRLGKGSPAGNLSNPIAIHTDCF
jgi:hypothetical protein